MTTQMLLSLLVLVLLLVVGAPPAQAVRPSHRAPVVFVVTTEAANATAEARGGTSIRTDGKWVPGSVPADVDQKLRAIFPQATVLAVNTDDESANGAEIAQWTMRECERVQRRDASDCFVVSALDQYAPLKTSSDPYDFRRWDSSLKRVVRHAIRPNSAFVPLGTTSPSLQPTPAPTVPDACEDRSQRDCGEPACEWLGVIHGCRVAGWCGFETKAACEHHRGCEFRRNKCRAALVA